MTDTLLILQPQCALTSRTPLKMDEQASQNNVADAAVSSQETAADQSAPSPQTGTPEDSREADTKKAEAYPEFSDSAGKQDSAHQWKLQLKRFHDDVNDVLASKENLKLKTLNIKTRPEFFREWTSESNRYMILMVNLRRRLRSDSITDQKTGTAA